MISAKSQIGKKFEDLTQWVVNNPNSAINLLSRKRGQIESPVRQAKSLTGLLLSGMGTI